MRMGCDLNISAPVFICVAPWVVGDGWVSSLRWAVRLSPSVKGRAWRDVARPEGLHRVVIETHRVSPHLAALSPRRWVVGERLPTSAAVNRAAPSRSARVA